MCLVECRSLFLKLWLYCKLNFLKWHLKKFFFKHVTFLKNIISLKIVIFWKLWLFFKVAIFFKLCLFLTFNFLLFSLLFWLVNPTYLPIFMSIRKKNNLSYGALCPILSLTLASFASTYKKKPKNRLSLKYHCAVHICHI